MSEGGPGLATRPIGFAVVRWGRMVMSGWRNWRVMRLFGYWIGEGSKQTGDLLRRVTCRSTQTVQRASQRPTLSRTVSAMMKMHDMMMMIDDDDRCLR